MAFAPEMLFAGLSPKLLYLAWLRAWHGCFFPANLAPRNVLLLLCAGGEAGKAGRGVSQNPEASGGEEGREDTDEDDTESSESVRSLETMVYRRKPYAVDRAKGRHVHCGNARDTASTISARRLPQAQCLFSVRH